MTWLELLLPENWELWPQVYAAGENIVEFIGVFGRLTLGDFSDLSAANSLGELIVGSSRQ